MEPLELRTHTSLWRIEKRLYKLYDFTLPIPVSVRQLGVVFAVGVPWLILVKIIGIPFAPPFGHLIWIAPPVLVAWWANKPVAEGKRLGELLISQIRYVTQARTFARMRPFRPDTRRSVRVQVWHPGKAPQRDLPAPELQSLAELNPTPGH